MKAVDICISFSLHLVEFLLFHKSFLVDVLGFSKLIIVSANDSFASPFLIFTPHFFSVLMSVNSVAVECALGVTRLVRW